MIVASPPYKVFYNNKNITNDISANLIALVYHDKEDGSADDLQLHLEDTDALWKNGWYPQKGANLQAQIGASLTGGLVDCGKFSIDEIEYSGVPDVVAIKSLSSFVTKKLKTKATKAHERKTLKDIINFYAQKHGFKVVGQIENISINRVSQYRKGDAQFLHSMAATYGYLFNIKGDQMIFTKVTALDQLKEKFQVERSDLLHYTIKDKTAATYASAALAYHGPIDHTVFKAEMQKNLDQVDFPKIVKDELNSSTVSDNILKLYNRVENQAQADAMTIGALYDANRETITGTFSMPGNPTAVAGNNFVLNGFYKLNGLWHITESIHRIDKRNGYVTDLVATKVGAGVNAGPKKTDKATIASSNGGGTKSATFQTASI